MIATNSAAWNELKRILAEKIVQDLLRTEQQSAPVQQTEKCEH